MITLALGPREYMSAAPTQLTVNPLSCREQLRLLRAVWKRLKRSSLGHSRLRGAERSAVKTHAI